MFRFVLITALLSTILCMTKPEGTTESPSPPPTPHPLMLAMERKESGAAELLIEFGCNVLITDEKLNSPMHVALRLGNEKYVELLLKTQASKDGLNNLQHTPLITGLITKPGNPASLMLAKAGANVYYVCPNGLTALHWAIFNRDEALVKYLIAEKVDLNAGYKLGYPPIVVALMTHTDDDYEFSGFKRVLKSLVEFRGPDREENTHALISKLVEEEEKIKDFLSDRSYLYVSEYKSKEKYHSERYTTETENFGMIPLLLNGGANPDLAYKRGDFEISPLNLAAYYKNNEAARRLLTKGARVGVTTFNGYSPFLIAIRNSYLEPGTIYRSDDFSIVKDKTTLNEKIGILSLLLKKKAWVNQANDLNETAILWAVAMGDMELMSYLKKHGAEMDLPETSKKDSGKILVENEKKNCHK